MGDFEVVARRLLADKAFRDRLMRNPGRTLEAEGYSLTAEELDSLKQDQILALIEAMGEERLRTSGEIVANVDKPYCLG